MGRIRKDITYGHCISVSQIKAEAVHLCESFSLEQLHRFSHETRPPNLSFGVQCYLNYLNCLVNFIIPFAVLIVLNALTLHRLMQISRSRVRQIKTIIALINTSTPSNPADDGSRHSHISTL